MGSSGSNGAPGRRVVGDRSSSTARRTSRWSPPCRNGWRPTTTTAITVAEFLDVADGLQPGQFSVGHRSTVSTLTALDPIYRQLLDEPVTAVVAVTGGDGRPNLTPIWFDYQDNLVLINVAEHR